MAKFGRLIEDKMSVDWNDSDNLCPARISGVLIGITLLYIFVCIMIDGILKISSTFQIASSSFSWRHLMYKIINFLMFAGGMFHFYDEMTLPQVIVYSFGWVATICSLAYVVMLEDTYPFQLLAPFIKFSNDLSLDEWWYELQDAYDSQNLLVEMKYKLRVTTPKILAKLVDAFEKRMDHRYRNNANICRQSVWLIAVNISLFIVNMSTLCQKSNYSFLKDLISVSCIVLSLALYEDYCDVQKGDYLVIYNKKLEAIKKAIDTMKPMSFRKAVKLVMVSNRLAKLIGGVKGSGADGGGISNVQQGGTSGEYVYNQTEYDRKKKQCSEDVVEDCTNIFQFYVSLKKQDEAKSKSFSQSSNEPLTVGEDPRALAVVFSQLVADEIVRRTSKPERPAKKVKKSEVPASVSSSEDNTPRDTINTMSLIILRVTTDLVAHLNHEIVEKEFTAVDLFEVRETLIQLWMLMMLQKRFDERMNLKAPQCADALLAAAQDWSKTTMKPLQWVLGYSSAVVEERSFQILYTTDIVLNDNSAIVAADGFAEPMGALMSILQFEATPEAIEVLWGELFEKESHLEYMCVFNGVPHSVTRDEKAARARELMTDNTAYRLEQKEQMHNGRSSHGDTGISSGSGTGTTPNDRNFSLARTLMGFKSKADRFITDVPADFIAATGGHEQVHPEASFVTEEAAMEVAIEEDAEKNVSGRVVKYLFMTKKFFKMWWRHSLFLSQFRSHSGSGFASSAKMNSNTSTVARSWGLRLLGMLIWVCSPAVYFVEFVIVTVSVISSFCTVVRDSASYIKWVSSDDNPFKNIRVLRIVLDRGGEASLMGYMSFTFFRCAQFMGQVATDFTRVGVVSCWLVVFLFVLVPTNKTSTKEWLKAIITAIAIIVGGYMSLDIRYNNLHDVTFLGLPAKYDFNRMDISLLAPILYGMMHNCLLMWCFLPLTMCRALLTWIMDIPYHGEWISKYVYYCNCNCACGQLHSLY